MNGQRDNTRTQMKVARLFQGGTTIWTWENAWPGRFKIGERYLDFSTYNTATSNSRAVGSITPKL